MLAISFCNFLELWNEHIVEEIVDISFDNASLYRKLAIKVFERKLSHFDEPVYKLKLSRKSIKTFLHIK